MRSLAGPAFFIVTTVGYIFLGGLAWYIRDWRKLLRWMHSIGVLSIFYFRLIPESCRWLLAKGQNQKVAKILLKIVKINKIQLSSDMQDVLENRPEYIKQDHESDNLSERDINHPKFTEIFKYPKFCCRILVCALCWITNVFLFYGLNYTSVAIGGNKYLSFILVSLGDTPGQIMTVILVDRIGRRKLLIIAYFMSGISLFVSAFIGNVYWFRLVLYLLGKCAIGAAFSTTYIFTSEILPTFLRHRLFGICASFGRIGSVMASQTLALQDIYMQLPALLFACSALGSAFLSFTLPETLNSPLPDSISDAMRIGKRRREKTVPCQK